MKHDAEYRIDAAPLLAVVDDWLERGGRVSETLTPAQARGIIRLRNGEQPTAAVEWVDRLLIRLGMSDRLADLLPPPDPGKRSGLWTKPHPLRRLTEAQVKAAHRLHVGGLSQRELGRLLFDRYGYSTPHACANALSRAFKRGGLPRRNRIEATVLASTTHGHGARHDKAAYKRWHRATFGPWASNGRAPRTSGITRSAQSDAPAL